MTPGLTALSLVMALLIPELTRLMAKAIWALCEAGTPSAA